MCGEDVPRAALACPECGADHASGWREDAQLYDALDLPDAEFDHDEFVRAEFGSAGRRRNLKPRWLVTAIGLIVLFALIYFLRLRG